MQRIVSGGQTGVDRAALDAALARGLAVGGWCPRGRRAEDGPLAAHYPLRETPSRTYAQRTAWNVRDSDGTLILAPEPLTGGTALTLREAQALDRPALHLDPHAADAVEQAAAWVQQHHLRVLNVAGPRASEVPGIYGDAHRFMERLLARVA